MCQIFGDDIDRRVTRGQPGDPVGDVVHCLLDRACRPIGEDKEHAGRADHPIYRCGILIAVKSDTRC